MQAAVIQPTNYISFHHSYILLPSSCLSEDENMKSFCEPPTVPLGKINRTMQQRQKLQQPPLQHTLTSTAP